VPGKKPSSEPNTATKAMRGVQLLAYPYEEGRACCEGMTSVGSAITTRGGKFEFKKLPAGEYWVAIRANGRDASIHVSYEPMQGPQPPCSDYTLEFNDTDKLGLMLTITLD
jgi:hypothetical protein